MLRALHFSPAWLNRTQTWLYNQVKQLEGLVENHVVCRSTRHESEFPFPRVHQFKRDRHWRYLLSRALPPIRDSELRRYISQISAQVNPDVIHSHFGNNGWLAFPCAQKLALPHVVTFYGQDVSRLPQRDPQWFDRYREMFAYERTLVLCEGAHMAESVHRLGCPQEKIRVHHLGVKVDRIEFKPRQWAPGKEPLKVLIAATFREKKGIPYALQALGEIARSVPLQISIIGDADSSPTSQAEKANIESTIDKFGLRQLTTLLGFQSAAKWWEVAQSSHIFVSTSVTAADGDTEGGAPVSVIEMAASGMPVISSVHCDIPDIIKHGETGWLAAERDVPGIVRCIEQCISNAADWQPMLLQSRAHIEREYDVLQQSKTLANHYAQLSGKAPGNGRE